MAYAGNIYEKKRQLNMFYINDYGGFWIELLPLLIRSNNIVIAPCKSVRWGFIRRTNINK